MRSLFARLSGLMVVVFFGVLFQTNAGQIVFTSDRDGNHEIYTMDDDGTNQENVSDNSAGDLRPNFCPNGKIVFQSNRDVGSGDDDMEIYIMDNDGTDVEQLTDNTVTDEFPDCSGGGITFRRGLNVCTMDEDGDNEDCSLPSGFDPGWVHRSGTSIAYHTFGINGTFDLWTMDPERSVCLQDWDQSVPRYSMLPPASVLAGPQTASPSTSRRMLLR